MLMQSRLKSLQPGQRVRLPSGRQVQLRGLHGGRGSAVWVCAYLEHGQAVPLGIGGRGQVVLRQDWLLKFARSQQ